MSFSSGTFKTYDIPSSKYEGYTGYLIKPIVDGDWADTYACVIAGKTSTKFGIRNIGTDTFSWNVSCTVIFIAN